MPSAGIPGANGAPRVTFPFARPVVASVPTVDPVSVATVPVVPAVLFGGLVFDGASVTRAMGARTVRRSPRSTGRSVVTGPGAKTVLFFD